MKSRNILATLVCVLPMCMSAQTTFKHSPEALDTLRNNYQGYPFLEIVDTPAPKGYKPFYMTHYGRHGSRYLTGDSYTNGVLLPLEEAEKNDNLTETGKMLLADMREFARLSGGMYGIITEKGGRELAGLGRRCAERFPEVFSGKNGNRIYCVASTIQRCILSMGYYVSELLCAYPDLEPEYKVGEKYMEIILKTDRIDMVKDEIRARTDSLRKTIFDKDRMCGALFVNPEAVDFDPWNFAELFFHCAADETCLETDIDLFKYFSPEEVRKMMIVHNNRVCYSHANSELSAAERLPDSAPLIRDIITRAEAAIAGDGSAADFRFGHDSGLIPLSTFLCIEGFDTKVTLENAHEHCNLARMSPMASNLQIILYRKKKSDVILAKILFNEKETRIVGLEPVRNCYYDWKQLSEFVKGRISELDK